MNALLVAEGVEDVELIGEALHVLGYEQLNRRSRITEPWTRFVVRKIPDNFHQRLPDPAFYVRGEDMVVVGNSQGIPQLIEWAGESVHNIGVKNFSAIGFFCDADDESPENRYREVTEKLRKDEHLNTLTVGDRPGSIHEGPPKSGIYVFPDNATTGAMERLLLACGETVYPRLYESAQTYVAAVTSHSTALGSSRKKDKAVVGTMGQAIVPGKSNPVIIHEGKWLTPDTLKIREVQHFFTFVEDLVGKSL